MSGSRRRNDTWISLQPGRRGDHGQVRVHLLPGQRPDGAPGKHTHKRFPEKFAEYFTEISDEKLTFSTDTGILFKYVNGQLDTLGQGQGDSTAEPWIADLSADQYANDPDYPGDPQHNIPESYMQKWEGRVGSWWVTNSDGQPKPNFATELTAEILWKIRENYTANGVNALDEIDSLQLIFLHSFQSPFYDDVGGRPDIHVVADEVEADTAPFYSGLNRSGNVYEGTVQGGGSLWSEGLFIGYTQEFIDNGVRVVCHEFGHTLGLGDGPPSLYNQACTGYPDEWCEERYYYGTLNLMDQHRVRRSAIAPISTPWMATLPWREVVDFTGQNRLNIQLDDLMLGGKIYKYQLASNEMMLITYRAGNGVDGLIGADGQPALKSHGVEIWHVAGTFLHDLESNVKLWNIDELVPPVRTWEDAMAHPDLAEDRVDGYDNYDLWLDSSGLYRAPAEYGPYAGDASDFFPPASAANPREYVAYSWDTNPSCLGYSRAPEHEYLFHRRRPQTEPSSLEVTIRGVVSNGDAVMVDLVSAPFEHITYPDESVTEPFAVNDSIPITWTTDYATGDHTIGLTLDLYYLPVLASPELRFPIPGGQGIAATAANQPFNWTIQATDPSEEAAILAVFHNEYSEHVYEVKSATFEVAGDPVPRETLLLPVAGAEWISGLEYQVRWTDAYDHSTFAGVSIQYRVDGASEWYDLATDLTEGVDGYTHDTGSDENHFTLVPDNAMASSVGQLRLSYEYYVDGGTAISYSNIHDPIAVYPVAAQFADQTANIDGGYEGLPSSFAPVVTGAPGNNLGGVVVAIREAIGQSRGELYFVSTGLSGIELHRQTDYLPGSILPVGMTGLSVADYDGDGDDDIFACWPSGGGTTSKLLTLNGSQYEETNDQGVNPLQGIPSELLQNAQCASWIDYDHDGDLDLYLGRAVVVPGNPSDPEPIDKFTPMRDCLFENDGGVFTEVGTTVGLVNPLQVEATRFAIWADCDHDGQWELVVGGGSDVLGTRYFREVGCRQFEADESSPIHGTYLSDARWVDIDNDGFLDVVGLSEAGVVVFPGQAGGVIGSPEVGATIGDSRSFAVLDYDLDGWRDLIVKTGGSSSYGLFANYLGSPDYPRSFVDIGAATGVFASGAAIAAFPSDLDKDGDFDLIVGRDRCSTGTLLANELRDPVGGGSQHYVTLRLVSGVASGAYGATVILRDGSNNLVGIQVVEGGGNRESQASRDLVFGLGSYDGALTAEIHWPLGRVQSYPISANSIDQLVTIVEPVSFAIDYSGVKFTTVFGLDGAIGWQFDWTTDNWTVAALDRVSIVGDPDGCTEDAIILQPGDPGVEHSLTYTVDQGDDKAFYHHRLVYTDPPCDPSCVIEYSVGSNNGMWTGLVESTGHTGPTPKLCPLSL